MIVLGSILAGVTFMLGLANYFVTRKAGRILGASQAGTRDAAMLDAIAMMVMQTGVFCALSGPLLGLLRMDEAYVIGMASMLLGNILYLWRSVKWAKGNLADLRNFQQEKQIERLTRPALRVA